MFSIVEERLILLVSSKKKKKKKRTGWNSENTSEKNSDDDYKMNFLKEGIIPTLVMKTIYKKKENLYTYLLTK